MLALFRSNLSRGWFLTLCRWIHAAMTASQTRRVPRSAATCSHVAPRTARSSMTWAGLRSLVNITPTTISPSQAPHREFGIEMNRTFPKQAPAYSDKKHYFYSIEWIDLINQIFKIFYGFYLFWAATSNGLMDINHYCLCLYWACGLYNRLLNV